ncbi:MAG: hypothetical protein ACOY5C_06570 [Pseudomonadota bacterium]|uniref:hypothetical protein n=1 Tax=Thermithiobacillus tepidarius TaxID=929 RepID=UPI00041EC5B4|nr:hypothetical protein [Thermithiobacillus tepidarius]
MQIYSLQHALEVMVTCEKGSDAHRAALTYYIEHASPEQAVRFGGIYAKYFSDIPTYPGEQPRTVTMRHS